MDAPERAASGRAARSRARRSSHAAWEPPADREDPLAILERQARTRVPELVPIRYGRMAASPFAFFRGAAAVMAADLASAPVSGLRVQACGDAHLSNFGAYAAPDRRLVFDLNDFDESLPGPWEWDVKRLAASFAIAGRENGFKRKERASATLTAVYTYRDSMRAFASQRNLEVWYARLDVEAVMGEVEDEDPKAVRNVRKGVEKARRKDSLLDGYSLRQIARKVVGVGSVGTRAWVLLLTGADEGDPLLLQAKEAEESVLEPYVGRSRFKNHGRRVVEGQRLMQAASDIFLGWCPAAGADGRERDFYARSGDRIAIAAYLGGGDSFDEAIAEFAEHYADQAERDHEALVGAIDSGRIRAEDA